MKRKTRIRKEWLTKDEFSCKKCGVGNEHIGWNDKNTKHPAEQPEDVLFCTKCLHELTTKEELEDLITFKEVQYYGFWLRGFVSEHFIPCKKCQDELHNLLFDKSWWKSVDPDEEPIRLRIKFEEDGIVEFKLNFVTKYIEDTHKWKHQPTFEPCVDCHSKLMKILLERNLHIGTDVKPKIELWRKWHLTEEEK